MFRNVLIILLMLIPLIWTVNAAQTVTKDNFAEPIIEPKLDKYFLPGEKISFNFTIQPKTADDGKIIDGRVYEFNTSLKDPWMRVTIEYGGSGPVRIYEVEDYVKADVKDWDDGIVRIYVEVEGTVPEVNERVTDVIALGIHVQDSEEGALKSVFIRVVNKEMFSSYIDQLGKKYSEIEKKVEGLENKGVPVANIKVKLNAAKTKIDEGKKYFNQEDYSKADISFSEAESMLEEAVNLSVESETNYKIETASKRIETMFAKMTELEVLVQNLKKKGESTISYEIKLESYKKDYSELKSRFTQAQDFMTKSLYYDAQNTAEEIINTANEKISEIDALITEISNKLEVTPTPEKTETPTPEKNSENVGFSERFSGFFSSTSEWISKNLRFVAMLAGGVIVLGIGGYFGYRGLKGYMRKRKWDELK